MPRKSKLGEPNAFWKYGRKYHDDPWVTAIAAIDSDGDNAQLIEMLRSDEPLDAVNRGHLADLFERKNLKNNTNHPPKPSYDTSGLSFATESWLKAVAAVQSLIDLGEDKEAALKQVSKSHRIKFPDLGEAYEGRIGSVQRAKKKPK